MMEARNRPELGRRHSTLAAVLVTDVVDSTRMRVRLGSSYPAVIAEHDSLVRAAIDANRPIDCADTGDGFVAVFDSALDALHAACAAQWTIRGYNEQVRGSHQVQIRAVLSAGELILAAAKPTGLAFNEAKRLEESVAGAGEIWCTELFRRLASEHAGYAFGDGREVAFKGLDAPARVWQIDWQPVPPLPGVAPLPPALDPADQHPVFGRNRELDSLIDRWRSTDAPTPSLVLIDGEAGVGKSALTRELARSLRDQGVWPLFGRCTGESSDPFEPFGIAITDFAVASNGGRQFFGSGRTRLATIAPTLDGPDHETSSAGSDAEADRYELFEAVTRWITELSAHRDVLFVIDDLHLADEPSLALLDHLLRSTLAGRVLFAASVRESPLDHGEAYRARSRQLEHPSTQRIAVRGLGLDGVRALVEYYLGDIRSAAVVAQLFDSTRGNPLFLHGLMQQLRSASPAGAAPNLTAATIEGLGVPSDVVELFDSRAELLSPSARAVVELAAVIGVTVSPEILAIASRLPAPELTDALQLLRDDGLLVPSHGGDWSFAHAIVREAALGSIGSRRTQLHLAVAEALEAIGDIDEQAAELSRHYSFGTEDEHRRKAADYAVLAASRAMRAVAPGVAAELYERALDLYDGLATPLKPDRRCDLLADLANALKHAGDPRAEAALLASATAAQHLGDTERIAGTALATLTGLWANTGDVDTAKVSVLEHALDAVGEADLAMRSMLLAGLATELTFSFGQGALRREELSNASENLARQIHASVGGPKVTNLLAKVLEARHTALLHPDGLAHRRELLAELETMVDDLSLNRRFTIASIGCWTSLESGDLQLAKTCARRMDDVTAVVNHPRLRAIQLHWESSIAMTAGRVDDALELAAESYDMHRAMGTRDALVFSIGLRYIALWLRGELGSLLPDLEAACAVSGRLGMRAGLAHAQTEAGEVDGARTTLNTIDLRQFNRPIAHQDQLSALVLIALASTNLGDIERIETSYDLLLRHGDHYVFNGTASFGSVQHYLGLLAAELERFDIADAHMANAAKANADLPAPALLAESELVWASTLDRRGAPTDAIRARVLLENALTAAHSLGLDGLEYRCHLVGARL